MSDAEGIPVLPGLLARRRMPGAVLAGMLAALGQAPVALPWATLAGLAIAFLLHQHSKAAKGAGWVGWAFGVGYFAAALFWIIEPFFVEPWRHGWMAPFALVGLAGGLAIFWGVAAALARWLAPSSWAMALAWAGCLTLAELARSYVLTGFPWGLIGHVWVGWAPMQLAAWVGPNGLTFLTVLLVSLGLTGWQRQRIMALVVAVPFAVLYGLAMWQAALPVPAAAERPILRLVQPNAAQHLKWHPDHVMEFFQRQVDYTGAAAKMPLDLIIWPETAIPFLLNRAEGALARVTQAAGGVPVVLGIQRSDDGGYYNSLISLDETGVVAQVYDKAHLVPFGEYIPLASVLSRTPLAVFVEEFGYGYASGPKQGKGAELVDLGSLGRVLPLICYEAIFPQDVNAAPERADWLLQITNDAWFGQIAGPYQHLAQARLRAVEQGLPMVRVANTGVSAIIDARGQITAQIGLGQAGFLDAMLPPGLPPTFYARFGDGPALVVLLLLLLGLVALRLRKRH